MASAWRTGCCTAPSWAITAFARFPVLAYKKDFYAVGVPALPTTGLPELSNLGNLTWAMSYLLRPGAANCPAYCGPTLPALPQDEWFPCHPEAQRRPPRFPVLGVDGPGQCRECKAPSQVVRAPNCPPRPRSATRTGASPPTGGGFFA